jgi:uncharacterized protein DUF5666
MPTSTIPSRCSAVALAGLAAFALAACGSSNTPSSSSSASSSTPATSSASSSATSSSPAPAAQAKDRLAGIVGSIAGGKVTLTGPEGPGPVDLTPTTHISQLATAQLTDVTAGECVAVRPTKDTAGSPNVTAAAVLFGPATDNNGQCAPPGGRKGRGVVGTVASVTGNTITVTASDNSQSTVTVAPNTRYAKRSVVDASAIVAGDCLMAQGTKAGDGSLQATSVGIRPADSGPCGRRQGG